MDARRLTAAAAIAAFSSGTILGIFEVQDMKMPSFLTVILIVILTIMGGIALIMTLNEIGKIALRGWGLRSPVFRKDRPLPHQWLLDIAKADKENPASTVQVLDRRIMRWKLDARRPFLVFGVTVFNGSVHDVIFSAVRGPITFNGEPLETPVQFETGDSFRIMRGQSYELRVLQYIPPELTEEVHRHLSGCMVDSFGLSRVVIEVRADRDGAQSLRLPIGGNDRLSVGN